MTTLNLDYLRMEENVENVYLYTHQPVADAEKNLGETRKFFYKQIILIYNL